MIDDPVSIVLFFRLKHRFQRDVTRVCLQNIRTFTKNYELIILESNPDKNDLSEPLKKEIRPEDKWITFDKNLFNSVSLNLGFKEAKNKFVYIMANDILVHQHWLDELLAYYKPNSIVRVIGPSPWRADSYDNYKAIVERAQNTPIEGWEMVPFNNLSGGWFMEKTTFETIGPFDENFAFYFLDDDYRRRVNDLGFKCCFVPTSLVTHLASMTWFYDMETHAADPYNIHNEGKDHLYYNKKWGING